MDVRKELAKMRKGQMNVFSIFIGGSIMLLVLGMVLAFTFIFIANSKGVIKNLNNSGGNGVDITKGYNALGTTEDAINQFPSWLTLVVIALVVVGLLGLILSIIVYVRNTGIIGGGMQ